MAIPNLHEDVHAFLSDVVHEPADHLIHLMKRGGGQTWTTVCGRMAVPFDSPLKRYPRVLPTYDALTCMMCISEGR